MPFLGNVQRAPPSHCIVLHGECSRPTLTMVMSLEVDKPRHQSHVVMSIVVGLMNANTFCLENKMEEPNFILADALGVLLLMQKKT